MEISKEHIQRIASELYSLVDMDEPYQEHLLEFSLQYDPVTVILEKIGDYQEIESAYITDEYGDEHDITKQLQQQWAK